jgi:hypothetical protein
VSRGFYDEQLLFMYIIINITYDLCKFIYCLVSIKQVLIDTSFGLDKSPNTAGDGAQDIFPRITKKAFCMDRTYKETDHPNLMIDGLTTANAQLEPKT